MSADYEKKTLVHLTEWLFKQGIGFGKEGDGLGFSIGGHGKGLTRTTINNRIDTLGVW